MAAASPPGPEVPEEDHEQPFVAHLLELRDRILRSLLAVLLAFLALAPFADELYELFALPLLAQLPEGSQMIAIGVASPFLAPFKLTAVVALVLALPFVLYQVWAFVAPGLYRHEKRLVLPILVSSTALFYAGMAFAYFVVFPLMFAFLTATGPEGVAYMPDINAYLDFMLMLFVAFGVAFETPVATVLLVKAGATTPERLAAKRPYVIVGAFVVGMLLTPPDPISQVMMAVPMWLLFELGVLLSRLMGRRAAEAEDAETTGEEAAARGGPATPPAAPAPAGPEGPPTPPAPPPDYVPPTEAELEAELDRIEAEEESEDEEAGEDEPPRDGDAGGGSGTPQR